MHGPGSTTLSPNWAPRWGPEIRLIDDVLNTIPLIRVRKRRRWREARDEAIRLWEQAGIKFDVEVGPGVKYTYYDPVNPKAHRLGPLMVGGAVRLVRNLYHPNEDLALYYGAYDGAIAAFKLTDWFMDAMWRESDVPVRVRVITHEIGHCLGLAHGGTLRRDGEVEAGVMNGGALPNVHDLDSIEQYYLQGVVIS